MTGADAVPGRLPPLSLYIHFPWCVAKCPYCDFNSHTLRGDLPEQQYLLALLDDLQQVAEPLTGRPLISVFLGGGTPSLFSAESMQTLLDAVRDQFACDADMETTLEANPGAIEHDRFSAYVQAGINRLSLGAQSFSGQSLGALGRIHSAEDTILALEQATSAGFRSINCDLMYGLPGQSAEDAVADISRLVSLGPQHVSHYNLTIEPNTVFSHQRPELPDADVIAEMGDTCAGILYAQGFQQYEVSAYSLAGHRSRHNLNYWMFGDYAAIGAGAHSKLTDPQGRVRRAVRKAHPREYMLRCPGTGSGKKRKRGE